MKTVISALLVVVIAAFPAAAQTGKAKKSSDTGDTKSKTGDYYPLKVGNKWTFEVDAGAGQKVVMTSVIAAEENSDGKPLARLEVYINGQKAGATEHLMTNKDGVFRVKFNNVEFTPPLCMLKYPLKAGQSWEIKTSARGQQLDVSCRQGAEEDVQVPAGKYHAVPCTIQVTQPTPQGVPMKIVTTYWFVENVGFVKQKIEINDKVILQELTKYEPAK
jgi:hypothetical protein